MYVHIYIYIDARMCKVWFSLQWFFFSIAHRQIGVGTYHNGSVSCCSLRIRFNKHKNGPNPNAFPWFHWLESASSWNSLGRKTKKTPIIQGIHLPKDLQHPLPTSQPFSQGKLYARFEKNRWKPAALYTKRRGRGLAQAESLRRMVQPCRDRTLHPPKIDVFSMFPVQ